MIVHPTIVRMNKRNSDPGNRKEFSHPEGQVSVDNSPLLYVFSIYSSLAESWSESLMLKIPGEKGKIWMTAFVRLM